MGGGGEEGAGRWLTDATNQLTAQVQVTPQAFICAEPGH